MECAIAIWTFSEAMDIGAVKLPTKILWSTISYLGVPTTPFFFYCFSVTYAQPERPLTWKHWVLNGIIPFLTIIAAATNTWHGWLWPEITLDPRLNVAIYGHGPWWWLFAAFSYFLYIRSAVILWKSMARYHAFFKLQSFALIVASILPFAGNVLYVFHLTPVDGMDWTPVGLTFSSLIIAWILFRYRMLDLVPVARGRLVDTMSDAVLVLDERGRIVDANPAMQALLGSGVGQIIGQPAGQALAGQGELAACLQDTCKQAEISFGEGAEQRYYDLRLSQLHNRQERPVGRLMVLRDITSSKRLQEEREQLIAELQRALVEVKTLSGLLPICANCKKIRDDRGYWRSVEDYVGAHAEVEFTHGICPDCMKKLYPELEEQPEETSFHDENDVRD